MGLFGRREQVRDDSHLTDAEWLAAGYGRFTGGKSRHFGSPETMRAGAGRALARGDTAAAVFFLGKAIDIAQTWLHSLPGRRTYEDDRALFAEYAGTVERICRDRPGAVPALLSDGYNENVTGSIYYMIQLADAAARSGRADPLYASIRLIIEATGMTPPETWRG